MNTLPSTLASAGACSDKPVPLWQPFVPTFSDADFNQAVDLFDLAVTPASVSSLHNSTGQASVLSCYPSQQNGPGALQPGTTAAPASESGHNADSQSVMGEVTTQPAVTASRHTDDPKVLKNREAQRRFKQKQKARSFEVEAQLAETNARLQQLQEQKAQLEARNMLLEKMSDLGMRSTTAPFVDQAQPAVPAPAPEPFRNSEPSITLSLWGKPRIMTAKELYSLSLPELSTIWTDYVHEMGACLIQLADSSDDSCVTSWLHKLTSEAMTLIAYRTKIKQLTISPVMNEDVMIKTHDKILVPSMDTAYYRRILIIWNLSEEQMCDLMHLRKLSMTRRFVLSLERKAHMIQLAISDSQVLNPTENILTVGRLTEELRQNAVEDQKIFYKVARAVHRGVLTLQQTAENLVFAYPHIGSMEVMLDVLARQRGEPQKDEIVAEAQINPMQAEWKRLIQYHDLLGTGMYPDYLPLATCPVESHMA